MMSTPLRLALAALVVAIFISLPSPLDLFPQLPAPLRPFRPLGVSLLNHALRDVRFPSLQPNDILTSAQRTTGFTDFFDTEAQTFHRGLEILCDALEREAKLNFVGRVLTRAQLDIVVENRLKIAHGMRQNEHVQVSRPIFVVGMPRSGTTFLHNLLSLDEENFRAPRLWEIVDPVPPLFGRNASAVTRAGRKLKNQMGTAVFRYLAPNFAAVHPVDSDNAEECMPILSLSMLSFNFYTMTNVPTYNDWLMAQDQTEALVWHKRFLQASQTPEQGNRAWLLKAPWHMNHLTALLKVYPDARILVPHRDPGEMLASLCSLHARLYGLTSDELDLKHLGRYSQEIWEVMIGRFLAARREESRRDSFVDISFQSLRADPIGVVKQVYAQLGLTLSARAERAMLTWLGSDVKLGKRGASGVHYYEASWFGLDPDEIRALPNFKQYMDEYL